MGVALEDFDASLETTTRALLGDTITYTPAGGSPRTLKAIVDYADEVAQLAGSKTIIGSCAVEVAVSDVALPTGADEILLPKKSVKVFQPKQFIRDETGMNWLIVLKDKPGA